MVICCVFFKPLLLSLLHVLGLLWLFVYLALLVDVNKWRQALLALLARVLEERLAWGRRVCHVLAIVKC